MNFKPALSIIIPVYNTEPYLQRCIETVINQIFSDYEIIIINDASSDNSQRIINNYKNKYKNIRSYLLNNNIGVGNARNLGVKFSNGKYIGFIDSDDWIDSNYYQEMMNSIISTQADICIAGIETEYDDPHCSVCRYQYNYSYTIDKWFALHSLSDQYNHDLRISPIVNNKIYRKDLIVNNNLKFDRKRRSQDNYFSFFALIYSEKITITNKTSYHYYQRNESATKNFSKQYIDDYFYVLSSIKSELISRSIYTVYEKEFISYSDRCVTALLNNLFTNKSKQTIQKEYIKYILKKYIQLIPLKTLIDNTDIIRFKQFFGI